MEQDVRNCLCDHEHRIKRLEEQIISVINDYKEENEEDEKHKASDI